MGPVQDTPTIKGALAEVGPRVRQLRTQRDITLTALAEATGISKSTLSRLESGGRRPSLELLLPIAVALQVPVDELIGTLRVADPRVHTSPRRVDGRTVLPLTRHPGPLQAFKLTIPATQTEPRLVTHDGYEWLYVLSGQVRLRLAEHDITMGPGEAAEFDTRVPHWFGKADSNAVEFLSLFGREGERLHLRAKTTDKRGE
jgi:transcriptional regulator with XRE-family HTH domain